MTITLISFAVLSQLAAAEPVISPRITFQVSAQKLVSHDPLVVRVVMENTGKTPILLKQPFLAGTGWVQFERRYEGYAWHPIKTTNAGSLCYFSILPERLAPPPEQLAPGERIASYEVLFYSANRPLFAVTGKQEVRAFVGNDQQRFESESASIEVVEVPKDREKAVAEVSRALSRVFMSEGISSTARIDELERWQSLVGDSELKTTLNYTIAICRFWQAADPMEHETAAADLKRILADLGPIRNDMLSLFLAGHSVRLKKWDDVLEELSHVKIRTFKGDSLRTEAEYWKKASENKP